MALLGWTEPDQSHSTEFLNQAWPLE